MLLQFINVIYEIMILAFVAFGLAMSFGFLRIINMAHGELIMLGAYTGLLVQGWGFPIFLRSQSR